MRKWIILLSAALLLVPLLVATPVNLVVNGEFETPAVTTGTWDAFPVANVPGWSSGESQIELWNQGFNSSPTLGSDGLPTGQHAELNWNNQNSLSQGFTVPVGFNSAVLSFDAWMRGISSGTYSVWGGLSGLLANNVPMDMNGSSWTRNTASFGVTPGETVTLTFTATSGDAGNSPHIDQVKFMVVPEPATYALVGLGLLGVALYRRRRASAVR